MAEQMLKYQQRFLGVLTVHAICCGWAMETCV
jgi:hypothetical protein